MAIIVTPWEELMLSSLCEGSSNGIFSGTLRLLSVPLPRRPPRPRPQEYKVPSEDTETNQIPHLTRNNSRVHHLSPSGWNMKEIV